MIGKRESKRSVDGQRQVGDRKPSKMLLSPRVPKVHNHQGQHVVCYTIVLPLPRACRPRRCEAEHSRGGPVMCMHACSVNGVSMEGGVDLPARKQRFTKCLVQSMEAGGKKSAYFCS